MMGRGPRAALAALFFGATGLWCTAAQAQAFIEGQMDTWAKVVKANNIKPD